MYCGSCIDFLQLIFERASAEVRRMSVARGLGCLSTVLSVSRWWLKS